MPARPAGSPGLLTGPNRQQSRRAPTHERRRARTATAGETSGAGTWERPMCPTLGSMHFSRATRVREWCVNRVHGADGRHRVVHRGRNRRESARVPSLRKTAVQGLRLGEYSDHIVVHQLHKETLIHGPCQMTRTGRASREACTVARRRARVPFLRTGQEQVASGSGATRGGMRHRQA